MSDIEPQNVSEAIAAAAATPVTEEVTEEPETVETEEVETEAVETEEVETTDNLEVDAPEGDETQVTTDDPFEAFGGRDTIEQAHKLYEASRTQDGLVQIFIEAGKNLGVGYDRIQALFGDNEASGSESEEEDDPDRPMTAREFKEFQDQQASKELEKQQGAAVAQAHEVVKSTVKDLGVDWDSQSREVILQLGDKYLDRGNTDPEAIKSAVQKGHADFIKLVETERKEYVKKKKTAAQVPKSPTGNSETPTQEDPEPKDVQEAIKMARKRMSLLG